MHAFTLICRGLHEGQRKFLTRILPPGLTTNGVIFKFAQNDVDLRTTPVNGFNQDYRGSEFAGACYSPDGKRLFFNIQSPGITFAVRGPWGSGGL